MKAIEYFNVYYPRLATSNSGDEHTNYSGAYQRSIHRNGQDNERSTHFKTVKHARLRERISSKMEMHHKNIQRKWTWLL